MSRPCNLENLMSLQDTIVWASQTYGGGLILEGSTAFVGFDSSKDIFTNYWYCDNTADDVQINAAQAYVVALGGGSVEFESGTYVLADPIIPTGNELAFKGQGADTLIDGDGLATTEHCFHITGRDHITIRDMSIQTQSGGAKNCYCIFIEDGSDNFHIHHIDIPDGDDNAIHIEGTTITRGLIEKCHINGVDGNGIHVDMDAANTINRLHILDNDIISCGGAGIYFDASGGNNYCLIESNIIALNAGIGIYVNDFVNGQILANECLLGDLSGIHVVGSSDTNLADNQCLSNERHGIFLSATTVNCLVDGNICNDNDDHDSNTYDGINVDTGSNGNRLLNNTCLRNHNYGIYTAGTGTQINNNETGVNDRHGIVVHAVDCQVNDNDVYDNGQDSAGTYHGIYLMADADRAKLVGNDIDGYGDSQEDGIHLADGAVNVDIIGNYCYDGMGDGINLVANNDSCFIDGNYLMNNDDYGIIITAATCNDTCIGDNYMSGNVTGEVSDTGTETWTTMRHIESVAGEIAEPVQAPWTSGHIVTVLYTDAAPDRKMLWEYDVTNTTWHGVELL